MPDTSERIIEAFNRVLTKLTSARFIAAITAMVTMSLLTYKALLMAGDGSIDKEFFFIIFTSFSTIVGMIVTFYFTKEHNDSNRR